MTVDIESVTANLRQMQTGGSVHTINKAVSYLRTLSKPWWAIKDDAERVRMFEAHVIECRKAIASKSAGELRRSMRRWF